MPDPDRIKSGDRVRLLQGKGRGRCGTVVQVVALCLKTGENNSYARVLVGGNTKSSSWPLWMLELNK